MRGFNRAIIAGNLTRDPEVRYTVNKKAFARFGVAVNSSWKNVNGEVQETTDYINIVVWGAQAENCGKFLKKGRAVLIEGRIKTGSYDAKDGSGKKYTTEVWADNVNFLSSGQQGSGNYSDNSSGYNSQSSYVPGDEDFGRSISESGFSGEISQGLTNNNDIPDGINETDIPF